jgi:hypothetical protein
MRLTRLAAVIGAAVLTTMAAAYHFTYEPAPEIAVQWATHVTWDQRLAVEQRLRLVRPRRQREWTIVYDLVDTSEANIRVLAGLADIEHATTIDRRTMTIPADAPYGLGWMWIGNRLPLLRRQGVVPILIGLSGVALAHGLAGELRTRATRVRRATAAVVRARRRALAARS